MDWIILSNAVIDKTKIVWVDRKNGSVFVHFTNGEVEEWDGENARTIWVSFGPDNDWQKDGREIV